MLTRSVLLEVLFLIMKGTCLSAEKLLLGGNSIITVHNANGTNDLLEVSASALEIATKYSRPIAPLTVDGFHLLINIGSLLHHLARLSELLGLLATKESDLE